MPPLSENKQPPSHSRTSLESARSYPRVDISTLVQVIAPTLPDNKPNSSHEPRSSSVFTPSPEAAASSVAVPVWPEANNTKKKRPKLKFALLVSLILVILTSGIAIALISTNTPPKTSKDAASNSAKQPNAANQNSSTPKISSKTVTNPQSIKGQGNSVQQPTTQQFTSLIPTTVPTGNAGTSLPNTIAVYNRGNYSYYYAGGREYAVASGASVRLSQAQPQVNNSATSANHSLMELSAGTNDGKQYVEVGWVVDPIMNGDSLPHLFVYHWVNGQTSCYNGCGFVQVSSSNVPGETVSSGTAGEYQISYSAGKWDVYYDNDYLGYFPETLWGGNFTQIGYVQVFGEVAEDSTGECIQMGNGIAGSSPNSAQISDFTLLGSSTTALLNPFATTPSTYTYGAATATGLYIGGPGSC